MVRHTECPHPSVSYRRRIGDPRQGCPGLISPPHFPPFRGDEEALKELLKKNRLVRRSKHLRARPNKSHQNEHFLKAPSVKGLNRRMTDRRRLRSGRAREWW